MKIKKLNLDRVDILIHTYNHEGTIENCINSIINQSHQNTFVTVVDDCSTDRTWDKVNEIKDKFPHKILVKKTSKNHGGASLAREECSFTPQGGFWGMIDGDDWWLNENKIKLQVEKLNQNEMYVGCSGTTIIRDVNGMKVGHVKPSKEAWNFLDYVLGVDNLYVHVSSILWKNIFRGRDGFRPKLAQKNWPRGEWPLTLAALAESKLSIYHLDEEVSQYNFNGQGVWSSLSQSERNERNNLADKKIRAMLPLSYKMFLTLYPKISNSILKLIFLKKIRFRKQLWLLFFNLFRKNT